MKREIAIKFLQLGDHRVIVDAGSKAEAHWLGMGYWCAGGSVGGDAAMTIVESGYPEISAAEVSKRRGRPRKGDD